MCNSNLNMKLLLFLNVVRKDIQLPIVPIFDLSIGNGEASTTKAKVRLDDVFSSIHKSLFLVRGLRGLFAGDGWPLCWAF